MGGAWEIFEISSSPRQIMPQKAGELCKLNFKKRTNPLVAASKFQLFSHPFGSCFRNCEKVDRFDTSGVRWHHKYVGITRKRVRLTHQIIEIPEDLEILAFRIEKKNLYRATTSNIFLVFYSHADGWKALYQCWESADFQRIKLAAILPEPMAFAFKWTRA